MTKDNDEAVHARARRLIVASRRNGTLYTGVTSNLSRRAYEHRESLPPGFAARYGCKHLVWYERYETMVDAIAREKQIKGGPRRRKLALIEVMNPLWRDLYAHLVWYDNAIEHCERGQPLRLSSSAFDASIASSRLVFSSFA